MHFEIPNRDTDTFLDFIGTDYNLIFEEIVTEAVGDRKIRDWLVDQVAIMLVRAGHIPAMVLSLPTKKLAGI